MTVHSHLITSGARFAAFAAMALSVGCATIQYDAQADSQISKLQTDVDTQLVTLISLEDQWADLNGKTEAEDIKAASEVKAHLSYYGNIDAYNKIDVDLTTLKLRVDANPDRNTPLIDADLDRMRAGLLGSGPADRTSLRGLHHGGQLSRDLLVDAEKQFNIQFQSLLAYETALKPRASGK